MPLIIDGANVVGSRPDGWWRDRAGAARRLAEQIVAVLDADPERLGVVHLVVEGAARRAEFPDHPDLHVHRAAGSGDDRIAELARELGTGVVVITADRGLRERVTASGAEVRGPGTFLKLLTS